jgi:dihydrofolate reductase
MRKLSAFNFTTLNGYFKGPNGDISWTQGHKADTDESNHAAEGLQSGNILIFGRVTYQMMAGFWTSPMAHEHDPVVAAGMNTAEKLVFSKTLQQAGWNNTRLIKGDLIKEIEHLKQSPGKDMTILGSGSLISQLSEAGLIDEYELLVYPVALGDGTPLFHGLHHPLTLQLISARAFKSGAALLSYRRQ